MESMRRQSQMAEIKLVSKYYPPMGNYSYPRKEDGTIPMSPPSPVISRYDRSSVGSEGSAPGLIDDRTDSEVSHEDDYQHRPHTTELWDSFWQPGGEWRLEDSSRGDYLVPIKEQYPAVIPIFQQQQQQQRQHSRQPSQVSMDETNMQWPLPSPVSTPTRPASSRRAAATYSAFPSVKALPRRPSVATAPLSSTSPNTTAMAGICGPPPRPDRPAALLIPCVRQSARLPMLPATNTPSFPPRGDSRPKTSSGPPSRSKKSMDGYPKDANKVLLINEAAASRSSEDLTKMPCTKDVPHAPRHYKSTTYLGAARRQQQQRIETLQQQQQQQQQLQLLLEQQQQAEPHSVFEEDSDCEQSAGLSFFKFHKRSGSDKSCKSSSGAQDAALTRSKRRNRAETVPCSAAKPPASERERKVDVFGRMLGRRSR